MYTIHDRRGLLRLAFIASLVTLITGQTYSKCNPLTQGGCPADPALGTSKNVAFTSPPSNDFTVTGQSVSYDVNGAALTVAKSGDSPTLVSKWYIMFGHVDFVVKAAPGTGIVSSAVLLSDCLDEIDFEWLGGNGDQVQSNYFGKGQTNTGFNRGAFHSAPGNHDGFNTYSIDWTADQIVWSVNGNAVRVLKASDAEPGQYPQTPMQIKVGPWAGGDPANAPGTVQWAGGAVNYAAGPFSMYLKAIAVTDYSTGNSYAYDGTAGTWQSIKSNGGTINSSGTGKNTPVVSNAPQYSTVAGNPSVPFSTDAAASSVYATRTGYPWTAPTASAVTSTPPQSPSSSSSALPLASSSSGLEVKTSYNQQGFPTITVTLEPESAPSVSVTGITSGTAPAITLHPAGGNNHDNSTTRQNSSGPSNSGVTSNTIAVPSAAVHTPAAVNEVKPRSIGKGGMTAAVIFALAALAL